MHDAAARPRQPVPQRPVPTRVTTFAVERLEIEDIEAELVDRFTEEQSRARTLAAFLLIGAGAGVLLAIWALREWLPLRF